MNTVKAVIQVMGHSKLPVVPKHPDELRSWYFKVRPDNMLLTDADDATQHSYVIIPSNHRILNHEFKNDAKRHGKLSTIGNILPPPQKFT
jgi:histone deacetylase 6